MTTPNLPLQEIPQNSFNPSIPFNGNMQALDALVMPAIEAMPLSAPPATVAGDTGKRWIVGASATGAWAGKTNQLALCVGAALWVFFAPAAGWRFDVKASGQTLRFDGSTWNGGVSNAAPTSATGTGAAGQTAYDASYLYVCVAANTWKRVAIATW